MTLSPTLVDGPDSTVIALSTPGGDNQDQSLMQVLFHSIFFGMNAQDAVEAPRFQTEHLVSSFDNHAMSPGTLLLDERTPPAVIAELQRRKHLVDIRSRYASGAAPVMIRFWPERADRGRRGPVLLSGPRRRGRSALRRARRVRPRPARGEAARRWHAQNIYIGGSSWKYEGWLGQIYSRERYLSRGKFSEGSSKPSACASMARSSPRSAAISPSTSSPRRSSGASCSRRRPEHSASPSKCRNRSPARCSRRMRATAPQAGHENEAFLDAHVFQEMFAAPAAAAPRKTAL